MFPGGQGRCLTEEEFINEIRRQQERIAQEEREKEERAESRTRQRALKDAVEVRWKAITAEWEKQKQGHEVLQKQLLEQGILRKNLPKPPRRPKKDKIKAQVMQEMGFREEIDGGGVWDREILD